MSSAASVNQAAFDSFTTGELLSTGSAVQLSSIPCKAVRFKAAITNSGIVYIGTSSGVTVKAGANNTTTGFPMGAGDDSGWIPAKNLSIFWILGDSGSAGSLIYITGA